ncbi:acyl carrier protein [Kitasatospora sp. NPDC057541]|uniref:acyl carrier protein n=1 Tax=unclassified Kitasatospora TaxID=2633591 RepID=UPI0036B023E9
MSRLTFDDLRGILAECAGEDEQTRIDPEALDLPFTDLGYDSLALLETAAVIARRYGADLADEVVAAVETPRQLLDLVNSATAEAA